MKGNTTTIFANKATKVAHDAKARKDRCRESEIKASNRVKFDNPEQATDAGYALCKSCFPAGVDI